MKPKVLIPRGYGLNCEAETAFSYNSLGAHTHVVHINDLLANPKMLEEFHILALVGGFSDGDHIAAGKIHANRLRFGLGEALSGFINDGKLIIGVCNGFQALVKARILPNFNPEVQEATVTYNDSGKFEDRWVTLKMNPNSKSIWTKGIDNITLPVRHGEGKFRVMNDKVLERIVKGGQIALSYADPKTNQTTMEYPFNPNGSIEAIAGVCDPTGRVFGMMPHWEAYRTRFNHPDWMRRAKKEDEGEGMQIPKNALRYVEENLL